jgi:hypothetical protein
MRGFFTYNQHSELVFVPYLQETVPTKTYKVDLWPGWLQPVLSPSR